MSARTSLRALPLVLLACGPALDLPSADALPEVPPAELRQVVFEGYRGELRDVSLHARSARIDLAGERPVAQLVDVRIDAADTGRGAFEIRSERGEFDVRSSDFTLTGDVLGSSGPNRFRSDRVRYDPEAGSLLSEGPVRIERPNLDVRADSMDFRVEERRMRLSGGVVARMDPR